MKIGFEFSMPQWLFWLVPKRIMADLKGRSNLNGKAHKSFWRDMVELEYRKPTDKEEDAGK